MLGNCENMRFQTNENDIFYKKYESNTEWTSDYVYQSQIIIGFS